jgi:Fe-S cluster biogenesis protein NfuA
MDEVDRDNVKKLASLFPVKEGDPVLLSTQGDVRIAMEDGVVKVRLRGACGGCPMATMTLKHGIEVALKNEVPGVKSVESVR